MHKNTLMALVDGFTHNSLMNVIIRCALVLIVLMHALGSRMCGANVD